ncbi:MAG: FAD-binding oxidoreductase [Psychroflexus sp.]|nr:FAD-binding oxidoreductase [Psychroflexus sp.]MDN6310163.1 FAD-binding oxidoreductase [Psychroflexus sp.]
MEKYVKIKQVVQLTHNVKQLRFEKPSGYDFTPGHATEVSINKPKWKEKKRPFTFTNLTDDDMLEFTIKIYDDHSGVTQQIDHLTPGDEFIIRDTWGAISYNGNGYIIAGGAGITPYIAILRDLNKKDQLKGMHLIYSNKTDHDIILKEELDALLGDRVTYVITDQKDTKQTQGFIDKDFLKDHIDNFDQSFYVCGPPKMTKEIGDILNSLGASTDAVTLDDQ